MKILIADKDLSVCTLVATRLRARGYEVLEMSDSENVMRHLERELVDLLLLSAEMERIGGYTLIEVIRKRSELMALPIILITEADKISDLITSQEWGYDDFLVKPFDPLVLQLRVGINISRSQHRIEANALTHLPGNAALEKEVKRRVEKSEKFSVLYMDINQFKSFNDYYGFEKGDDVIRQTAKILIQTAHAFPEEAACFVGHIGGDDFIVVMHPTHEEAFARRFLTEFDRIMPTYYNEADQKAGMIRVKNRQGKVADFPLMSCAVGACNNLYRPYKSLGEIAQDAVELKSFLKSQQGSHYLRDRRSSPVRGIEEAMQILAPEIEEPKKESEDFDPLGQVLMNAGLITKEQLSLALKKHLETGQRLGQVLISMNAVKSEDVGRMLEKKLNIPYVSLRKFLPARDMLRLFTVEFIRSHRVLPLEIASGCLKLGMCDPFDLHTLDSIERITGMKPMPCLALEDEFEDFLERFKRDGMHEEKIS